MFKKIIAFSVCTFLINACSTDSSKNENTFLYPDSFELTEIGSINGTVDQVFARPTTVLPLSSGEFIVADSQTLTLHLFDDDFNYQHSFGGSGNGPGEFQRFNDLSVQGTSVTVYDGSRSTVTNINVEKEKLNLAETSDFTYSGHPDHPGAMFWRFIEGKNGDHIALFYDFNISSQEELTYHRVVALPYNESYQPEAEDPVAVFQYSPELSVEENIVLSVPFINRGLVSSLNGSILYATNNEPFIKVYDQRGINIHTIDLPNTSSGLTREEKTEAYDRMYVNSPDPERFRNEVMTHIPDSRPIIRSLQTDAEQRIWVRLYRSNDIPDWLVLDNEGSPIKQLSLPNGHVFRNASGNRIFTQRNTDEGPEIVILELDEIASR